MHQEDFSTNFAGTESPPGSARGRTCVIGFGNIYRRDDGLGPFIAEGLARRFGGQGVIRILVRHQLEPELADELMEAATVVFVDATIESLGRGWILQRVAPQQRLGFVSHTVSPGWLVSLMASLSGRTPSGWLVSVQGEDFNFGQGLSPLAGQRAQRVIKAMTNFLSKEEETWAPGLTFSS